MSESFFSISHGVLELWRKNLREGRIRDPPPAWIGLNFLFEKMTYIMVLKVAKFREDRLNRF